MRKILSTVLSFGLLFQQSGLLYAAGEINLANYLSQAKGAIVQPGQFRPAQLRYISYDIKSNDFKLLLDKGGAKLNELSNSLNFSTPKLNDATQELFNYFLIGLALPNDTFWVNLRPDAPENIIDPLLEKTDIGKIFLEADLQLKKDTSSLTSPQNPEGKQYWDKLYKKAGELFGSENITIPTITRPWIVPNEVIVRETEDSAYIYKATLKVMLEEDYLRGMKDDPAGGRGTIDYSFNDQRLKELNEYSTQLIRETIIPKLTKEINSSKRYAQLRQVYYSLVLARWFKQKYSSLGSTRASEPQGSGASANNYLSLIDSGNLANLASPEPCDKQAYFQAYQKSFKDGEYNLKETVSTPFGQSIRSYISGGIFVDYNPAGIKVNSSPVTNILTEQPPVTTASPLTIEQEVRSFFESLPANYPQGKEEKPSWDEKMSLLENIEKVKEYLAVGIGIYSKLAQSCLTNSNSLIYAEINESLESGALPKSKGAQEYFSFIDGRNKFQEYWNNAFDLEQKIRRGKKPAAVSSPDINKAIVDFRFNFESSLRELAELKVDPNLAREVKEELPEYYTEVDGILKRMEEDIKSEYPLKFILGQNISSLNKAYGGFINKTKKMFESVPPPIFNFKSNLGRLLETFNSALTTALPLTPREILELAKKEINETYPSFKYYRVNYYISYYKRIEAADPFSKKDVIEKLSNEIDALQDVIDKSKYSSQISDVVAFEALRIKNFFKELRKELKNSSNQSAETRNNEVEKSDSPLMTKEKFLSKIDLIQEEVLKSLGKGNNDYYYKGRVYENDTYVISKVWRRTEKSSSEKINFRRIDGGNTIEIDVNSLWLELFYFYIFSAIDTILPGIEYPVGQNVIRIKYDDYKNLTPEVISKFKKRDDSYAVIHSASNMILPKVEIKVMRNAIKEVLKIILMDANINTDINKEFRQIDELLTMLRVTTARTRDSDLYILNNVFERMKGLVSIGGKPIHDVIRIFDIATAIQKEFNKYCDGVASKLLNDYLLEKAQKDNLLSIERNIITADKAGELIIILDWLSEKTKEKEGAAPMFQIYKDNLLFIQEVTSPRAAGSPLTIKQFKDKASEILRGLGSDFLEESIRMEYIKGRKNLIKYAKQIIPKIEFRIEHAKGNERSSRLSAKIYKAQAKQESDRELQNSARGTGYSISFEPAEALEKQASQAFLKAREYANAARDLESAKESLPNLIKELSSSSPTNIETASSGIPGSDLKKGFGGIDLTDRMLKIKLERVGSFASSALVLPEIANLEALDLDQEYERIQAMASVSIRPSDTRILEFAAACYYRGEFDQRLAQVSSCIKVAHLADEISGRDSSEALRLATMLPDALYGG